jgi:chemotaxis protein MotB
MKEKLEQEIQSKPELKKLSKQIEITITPEGLRIELIEDKNGTFYQSGSAHLSDSGQKLLTLLAGELKTLPNPLLIEGHTDATQYSDDASYSNWELSADRANSARRLLQQDGVRANQVSQVRGYADQFLRVKSNPYDPSNRRISILVKNENGVAPNLPQNAGVQKQPVKPDAVLNSAKGPAGPAPPAPATSTPAKPANSAPVNSAQSKPSPAKPADTGLMAKLAGLLPGKKK